MGAASADGVAVSYYILVARSHERVVELCFYNIAESSHVKINRNCSMDGQTGRVWSDTPTACGPLTPEPDDIVPASSATRIERSATGLD